MIISKIKLVDFRNYSNISISLGKRLNIFIGDNAQGKTNILEAIIILALTKSHRIGVSPNIIRFNKKKCKIEGVIKKEHIISKLTIHLQLVEVLTFPNNNRKFKTQKSFPLTQS